MRRVSCEPTDQYATDFHVLTWTCGWEYDRGNRGERHVCVRVLRDDQGNVGHGHETKDTGTTLKFESAIAVVFEIEERQEIPVGNVVLFFSRGQIENSNLYKVW